jgi:hypothetical protein
MPDLIVHFDRSFAILDRPVVVVRSLFIRLLSCASSSRMAIAVVGAMHSLIVLAQPFCQYFFRLVIHRLSSLLCLCSGSCLSDRLTRDRLVHLIPRSFFCLIVYALPFSRHSLLHFRLFELCASCVCVCVCSVSC